MGDSLVVSPTVGRALSTATVTVCRLLAASAAVLPLGGCGHDTPGTTRRVDPPVVPPVVAPVPTAASHGHFYGDATIGDEVYPFEGILTIDGAMRLHIGGPLEDASIPASAIQFIGESAPDEVSVTGSIVGEDCAAAVPGRFCVAPGIGILTRYGDRSELHVTTSTGEETWILETTWWDTAYSWGPADVQYLSGLLRARLAEFAFGNETILSIDGQGRLFFQSPNTGCIGNGVLAAHDDTAYSVYDIALTIANCNADLALLNGEHEGLVADYVWSPWDYWTTGLVMWLSSADAGAPSQVAMTVRTVWLGEDGG